MQAILDIVMGHVSMAGYHVPVPVIVFAALVLISLVTRESWWGVAGTVFVLFFSLFLPALHQF